MPAVGSRLAPDTDDLQQWPSRAYINLKHWAYSAVCFEHQLQVRLSHKGYFYSSGGERALFEFSSHGTRCNNYSLPISLSLLQQLNIFLLQPQDWKIKELSTGIRSSSVVPPHISITGFPQSHSGGD